MSVPGASGVVMKPLSVNLMKTFFVYDRVVKDPDAFILKKIVSKKYIEKFREYIDVELIETMSLQTLMVLLIERNIINPLEWCAIKEFDYEKNYSFLYKQFENMYRDSLPLEMVKIMKSMNYDYSVGDIFVWNPVDDERQRYDLLCTFGKESKIRYITGDYKKCVEAAKPNILYDWDVARVHDLDEYSNHDHTFFGIADYGFNFVEDKDNPYKLKYDMGRHKNVAFYVNYKCDESYKYKG